MVLRNRQFGAAAVELALISIPLVFLVMGGVEWARAMYTYNALVKATRDGARYLSGFDPGDAANYPIDRMKSRMRYGTDSPSDSTPLVVPGLEASMISVCDRTDKSACDAGLQFGAVPSGPSSINLVRVQITGYQYQPLFPALGAMVSVTFAPISTTMAQVQ